MTARVLCRQDVVESDVDEVLWTFREERERPYADVEVTCFADGSSPCSRCGLRHPWDQMLKREGLHPARDMPMGWGDTAAQRKAEDEDPAERPVDWQRVEF